MSSADALSQLNSFNNSRVSSTDALNQANGQYGVSNLASQVSNLRNLTNNLQTSIQQVDPSVTGRTSGSFVTEAQRSALVNREQTPLFNDLNTQSRNLNLAQGDLSQAQTMAGQMASGIISDQNSKYQSLMDSYNQQKAAETQAEQERQWWANFNEQKAQADRQFQATMAQIRAQYAPLNLGGFGGGGGAGGAGAPKMIQRNGGGFNFTNGQGQAISAATYSKLAGVPFRTLLSQMASAGDYGAKVGLNLIGNDYGVDMGKMNRGFDAAYNGQPLMSYGSNGARSIVNSLLW